MLILPIVNRDRILNVEIKLDAKKIRTGVCFEDAGCSDVIVNGEKFSDSIHWKSKDEREVLNFIRSHSLVYKRNYLVTTREAIDSKFYDVYEVAPPPKKVTLGLDKLYSYAVIDMQKELPNHKKGRYVSFEKLGVGEHLTDEKISKLEKIVKTSHDRSQFSKLFFDAGVSDLSDTLDFIQNFECTVISNATILERDMRSILNSLERLNTKDYRNLRNYYDMALSNRDIYSKLSYLNKLIYDKPLNLIQSNLQKQKQLVKVNALTNVEGEVNKVA